MPFFLLFPSPLYSLSHFFWIETLHLSSSSTLSHQPSHPCVSFVPLMLLFRAAHPMSDALCDVHLIFVFFCYLYRKERPNHKGGLLLDKWSRASFVTLGLP